MADDMLVRNFSERIIDWHIDHVDCFVKHLGKLTEDLGPEEIREFHWQIPGLRELLQGTRDSSKLTPEGSRIEQIAKLCPHG